MVAKIFSRNKITKNGSQRSSVGIKICQKYSPKIFAYVTYSADLSPFTQSVEYDIRVANISLFVYIGSPGLHRNRRQDLVATRYSPVAVSPIYIIYIGYQFIISFFPSNVHLYSLTYFGTECRISHLAASALAQ